MFRDLLIFMACLLVLAGCSTREEPGPVDPDCLVVGVDPNYAPFEFRGDNADEPKGFDIDLIQAVCSYNGWRAEFREVPFDNLLTELTGGGIGAAISAITITPRRQAVVDFSDPYYLTGQSIVVLSGDTLIADLTDLRGQRVGVQQGTTGEDMAKSVDGALVFRYEDIEEAFRHLVAGELDAVINDYPSSRTYLRTDTSLEICNPDLKAEHYGIAVRKESRDRLEGINEALAVLIGDGTYDSLHVKWFGYSWLEEPAAEAAVDF